MRSCLVPFFNTGQPKRELADAWERPDRRKRLLSRRRPEKACHPIVHLFCAGARTVVWGVGRGWADAWPKPAARSLVLSWSNVYASPLGVPASITRLNRAAIGGDTRSGLGTNSTMTTRPRGTSAARTLVRN